MPGMNTRSPRHEPIMMIRPPVFRCLSAACVATKTPRTLTAKTRSKSARVVSSTGTGMTVPALFTSTSSRPRVATVLSTAFRTASASAASAWSASEPERLGQALLVPEEKCVFGRGGRRTDDPEERVLLVRQLPGENQWVDPVENPFLSRSQLRLEATDAGVRRT